MDLALAGFSIILSWTLNDLGLDVLGAKIQYMDMKCDNYNLIQIARVIDNNNQNIIWEMGESPRNQLRSVNGYYIDHLANKCTKNSKCSPFFNDHWKEGGMSGNLKQKATIEDYPYGWDKIRSINLEVCGSCNGKVMNCLKYGGEFPTVGEKKLYKVEFNEKPSEDFNQALKLFNEYYKN
jgi:hypothetical protein